MIDFKTLNYWKRAYKFSLDIYRETTSFPREEKYGLTFSNSQSSNINSN